jgi:hypothetical protein
VQVWLQSSAYLHKQVLQLGQADQGLHVCQLAAVNQFQVSQVDQLLDAGCAAEGAFVAQQALQANQVEESFWKSFAAPENRCCPCCAAF